MSAYTTETVDTSGRRQAMAAVLFLAAAVVISYIPASTQQHVAASLRGTVLRPFVATQEAIITVGSRAGETAGLRRRLDSLVAVMAAEGALAEENRRLREMLELSRKVGPTFAAATLMRAGTTGSESTFLVDVGSTEGISPNAPVISSQGLLGMIRDVRTDQAVGMDWTHPDFRASAMTADGATYGVVESRRGLFREEDRLVLDGTAFHTRLEDGTVVLTSGLGGVFPRGVPIGIVSGQAAAEAGWRKSYWLRPLAEPGVATHVLVAVGNAADGSMDLSPVWPADAVMTEEQFAAQDQARRDSLNALGDSLLVMKRMIAGLAPRDGLGQRGSSGVGSLPTRSADLGSATSARPRVPSDTTGVRGVRPDATRR
jgi:rod shape-determining protein MreC